ncbi:hypothetical protein [Paracoccus sp. N5]|uniref:hypothetical protein n=1 Tax=Paracoccus sp. N5 TaxID=1101189 RepID=UPI000375CD88|nr:hypothetical protein [Paracoccus sp. N5]
MITSDNLNDVQAEFGKVGNLLAALDLAVDAVDESATGQRRRNLDALIGVTHAMQEQLEKAHAAFETLFEAARAGKGDAA